MADIPILHEDARMLVIAKPPGLLSVAPPKGSRDAGAPTVLERLRRQGFSAFAVHRLDRETSGVMVLARDPEARELLMTAFKGRQVSKTYLALVQGHPRPPAGTLRFPIKDLGASAVISADGLPAETRFRTVEIAGPGALLELELLTGRHNQARLHLAHIGHPVIGERKFAFGRDAIVRHRRAALHAFRMRFAPPWEEEERLFEAPLSEDLVQLLEKLRQMPVELPRPRPRPLPGGSPRRRSQDARSRAQKGQRRRRTL